MTKSKVYCESFCTGQGFGLNVDRVSLNEQDSHACLTHFHQAYELVIFGQISGQFYHAYGDTEIKSFDVVFVPTMETHDFLLDENSPKQWTLIQFEPVLCAKLGLDSLLANLCKARHFRLSEVDFSHIEQLATWLHDAYVHNPKGKKCEALFQLIVATLSESTPEKVVGVELETILDDGLTNSKVSSTALSVQRLQPVLNLINQDEAISLSLIEAAERCHVSAAHFSRLFKRTFRMSYSEYILQHKLHLAARLLSQGDVSVTNISYELLFSSPSHFISQFRKHFNLTPKAYRKQFIG